MSFCQFRINASNTNLDRDADNLQIEKSHYLILSVIPESLLMAMGSVYLNNKKKLLTYFHKSNHKKSFWNPNP